VDRVAQPLAQGGAQELLVGGVAVGVQEADRDRLGARRGDGLGHVVGGGGGELAEDLPARPGPLGDADAPFGRRERRGVRRAQAVELGPGLAPELDEVREALRGQERARRPDALQEGVRGHGHAVGEASDGGGCGAGGAEHRVHGGEDAGGLVGRGRRRLGRDDPLAVHEDGVGEGPAHVDPEQHPGRTLRGRGRRVDPEARTDAGRAAPSGRPAGSLLLRSPYAASGWASRSSVSARCWCEGQ
jgi:hypothetical protein